MFIYIYIILAGNSFAILKCICELKFRIKFIMESNIALNGCNIEFIFIAFLHK